MGIINNSFNMNTLTDQKNDTLSEWFDMIAFEIHLDKTTHEQGIMDEKLKTLYTDLANGDVETMLAHSQDVANNYYRKKITLDFLNDINFDNCNLTKLAINYNQNSILVWSEIKDDDDKAEDCLIMLQAKINAKYGERGYRLSNTIVEEGENIPLPTHYRQIKITE
jgi:hypothetical protein